MTCHGVDETDGDEDVLAEIVEITVTDIEERAVADDEATAVLELTAVPVCCKDRVELLVGVGVLAGDGVYEEFTLRVGIEYGEADEACETDTTLNPDGELTLVALEASEYVDADVRLHDPFGGAV
jgi:hypothetical protein